MVPEKLPTYTVAELEKRAEACVIATLGQIEIPIDIDRLVELQPNTDLEYWPGLERNHHVCGGVFLDIDAQRFVVAVDDQIADSDAKRNFYRMTVAEELGHLVLHGNVIRCVATVDDFMQLHRHVQWQEVERNAKRFAAAVLMPARALNVEADLIYRRLVTEAGYGNVEVIQKYLRNLLAARFEVSPMSMGIRLREWPMKINEKVAAAMKDEMNYLS